METYTSKFDSLSWYSKQEEKLNIYSHAIGVILSLIAAFFLIYKSIDYSMQGILSLIIYAFSQILIFSASTVYHAQTQNKKRYSWNIIDHAMIYVSIAGTYSPFCLITLKNDGGIYLFAFVWACALIGMLLKIRFTGKYNLISTLMYVAMGWVVVFYWSELNMNMKETGINLLIAGGVAYTIGAIIYMIEKIPYNHTLFHLFILLGAALHFFTIYYFI